MSLRTDGMKIVDADGRQIILRGINLVCKTKSDNYVTPCDQSFFAKFRANGFNVVRLGLQWDGVEPEPGIYDDVYLTRMKQQVQWAERHGLYVFLDMHQDLYGIKFGDGAPEWATLDDNLSHVSGDLWSDAYLLSDAVSRSFDSFWSNRAAADGIGLQDHFLAMWLHVAEFFSDCPNVVGYDLFNEPYPGTTGRGVFAKIAEGLGAAMATQRGTNDADNTIPDAEAGLDLWTNEEAKIELLQMLEDMTLYRQIASHSEEASQAFEIEALQPFYRKLCTGIAAVNPTWICFQEASYFTNMGIRSAVEPIESIPTVFAPHGYDLVVDTDHYEAYSKVRVEHIFATHRRVQETLKVPTLIGEWGAFSSHPITADLTAHILDIFDRNLWSHSYWCWSDGSDRMPYWQVLGRAYPMVVSGEILEMTSGEDKFELTIQATPGESIIHLPSVQELLPGAISIDGLDASFRIQAYSDDSDSGQIILTHGSGRGRIRIGW